MSFRIGDAVKLLLLITVFSLPYETGAVAVSVDDLMDWFDMSKQVIGYVNSAWKTVEPYIEKDNDPKFYLMSDKSPGQRMKQVMIKMVSLNRAVSNIEKTLTSSISVMGNLQHDLPKIIRMELKLDDLLAKISKIEATHAQFQDFLLSNVANSNVSTETFERHTLENFASYVVSQYPDSIQGLMEQMHNLIAPETWQDSLLTNEGGIFKQIGLSLEGTETNLCNVLQSPQQVLYNLYTSLQMTQLKGYTMMQFSWMLLRLYKKGNFTTEAARNRERYIKHMITQVKIAKKAIEPASQQMWRCDPDSHKDGETYTQVTKLLQGYIDNEVDLNSDESCRENCGYYSHTKNFGCYSQQLCIDSKHVCNGRIVDCKFIDSDMTVCMADKNTTERYKWVYYKNGNELGDTSEPCKNQKAVNSWWRYLVYHCSFCFCICDDPIFSDRYFNLRDVPSDIENNKVVTAIRFKKHDQIIHLQIQEGVLLPKGLIDESTVSWRPTDVYKLKIHGGTAVKDKDYHEMNWEERIIDLDDLTAPPNSVLTGIRLRKLGRHLNLEIRITPFNFTSGLLKTKKSEWISNDNTETSYENPRTELVLSRPHNSMRYPTGNQMDSLNNQFVQFTHTDIYKDVAQHTVPYIDTQVVGSQPPIPLSGAGIIHKGHIGYGGFIAPTVFTYNMGYHLQEDFDELPDKQSFTTTK